MLSLVNLFISCVALSTSVAAFSIPKPIRSQQFTDTFDNVTGIPGGEFDIPQVETSSGSVKVKY